MDKREQRIRRMYRLTEKTSAPQFPVPEVSKQGIPLMGTVTLYEPNIIVAASRRARYSIGDTMDTGDVAAMLDAIIEDAFSFEDNPEISFKLGDVAQSQTKVRQTPKSVAVGSNTLKILQQVVNLTDIQTKIKEYVRDCLKYGDNFIEIIYNQKLALIDGLQSYHPSSMLVETERFDLLQDPVTKIRQVNLGGVQIAEWDFWQISHTMWRTNDRYPYAIKSFLEDIYPDWLTLNKLESTLVLARLSRAYPRLIHYIDVTNQDGETRKSTFNSYVKNFTNASKNNTNGDFLPVEKDIYLTRSYLNAEDGSSEQDLTKIDFYDPSNTGLAQIGDIEYIRRKIFNRAPGAIVGIAGNRDISQQDIAYANLVKQVQRIGKAILKQIFDVQLVLTGQVDSDGNIAPYEIVLPSVHMQTYWKYADAQYRSSLKDIAYVEAGVVSRQSVYMDAFNATSDDWQEELSKIQNENAIFTPEKPTGTFGASSAANMTIAGQKGGVAKPADTTNASVASQQNAPNQQTK